MIDLLHMDTDLAINSEYGWRTHPVTGEKNKFHQGIDLTLTTDNIPAVLGGTVSHVGWSDTGGNIIYIAADDGTTHKYMHLAAESPLKVGQRVSEGQTIGTQGSTGASTGKHLHFQVEGADGTIDPAEYLSGAAYTMSEDFKSTGAVDGLAGTALALVGHIIRFLAVILLIVFAVYLFMKAFDVKIM